MTQPNEPNKSVQQQALDRVWDELKKSPYERLK